MAELNSRFSIEDTDEATTDAEVHAVILRRRFGAEVAERIIPRRG